MNNIDFNSMNDDEFEALADTITKERQRRYEERKAHLWEQVERAINEYVNNFGYIDVSIEGDCLHRDTDFSVPGELH